MRHRLDLCPCVALAIALIVPGEAAAVEGEGPEAWRIVDGFVAPWAQAGGAAPDAAALQGSRVEFAADRVVGSAPLACDDAAYELAVTPAEGLFQGSLPAPAEASARAVGVPRLPVLTLQVSCDGGVFDYHFVTSDTLLVALDNLIWRLAPEPGSPTPAGAVRELLLEHMTGDMGFTPALLAPKRRWLSADLATRIEEYFARSRPADEVPPINGDPFTDSQEFPTRFRLGDVRADGDAAEVRVIFSDAYREWPVGMRLRRIADAWLLDDSVYRDGSTFRGILSEDG